MLIRALAVLLLSAVALSAEVPGGKSRLWKWSIALLAAANVSDVATSIGHYEMNPVLGRGRFSGRDAGIKFGISSGSVVIQSLILRRRPAAERKAAYFNFALAGVTGGIAARNATR